MHPDMTARQAFHMLENETLWELADAFTALLAQRIDHAIVGGVAVCLHGYRRNTVDLDLLVRPEDAAALRSTLEADGLRWDAAAKEFRSAGGAAVQFVLAGESEGPGQAATFPSPSDRKHVTTIEGLPVLSLAQLIQSKLACGLGNLRRTHKDFADVVQADRVPPPGRLLRAIVAQVGSQGIPRTRSPRAVGNKLRRFEWTRQEFQGWARGIAVRVFPAVRPGRRRRCAAGSADADGSFPSWLSGRMIRIGDVREEYFMKLVDYAPPPSPSLEQQRDALQKGLGRAVQWALTGRLKDEPLLEACLQDRRYDSQIDAPRGDWLWELVRAVGAADRFRVPSSMRCTNLPTSAVPINCANSPAVTGRWETKPSARRLYEIVERKPFPSYCPCLGEEEIITLDGEQAFLFAARMRGRSLADHAWEWDDGRLMYLAVKLLGEERASSLLEASSDAEIRRFRDYWRRDELRRAEQRQRSSHKERMTAISVADILREAEGESKCYWFGAGESTPTKPICGSSLTASGPSRSRKSSLNFSGSFQTVRCPISTPGSLSCAGMATRKCDGGRSVPGAECPPVDTGIRSDRTSERIARRISGRPVHQELLPG